SLSPVRMVRSAPAQAGAFQSGRLDAFAQSIATGTSFIARPAGRQAGAGFAQRGEKRHRKVIRRRIGSIRPSFNVATHAKRVGASRDRRYWQWQMSSNTLKP